MKPRYQWVRSAHLLYIFCLLFARVVEGADIISPTNIVLNGSFEQFSVSNPHPYWTGMNIGMALGVNAADGRNYLEIIDVGSGGGFVTQTLNTTPAQIYHVSFAAFGNPAQLTWDGLNAGEPISVSTNTVGNHNWVYSDFYLPASSASTVLRIDAAGIGLDDVRAVAVPEPSVVAFLVISISLLFAQLQSRTRRANSSALNDVHEVE